MSAGESEDRAKRYHRTKRRILLVNLFGTLSWLFFLQFSGAASWLKQTVSGVSEMPWPRELAYLAVFFNLLYLPFLPLTYYSGFKVEKIFGLSNQTPKAWLRDEFKKYLLSLLFFIVTGEVFLALVRFFPDQWWIYAALGWLLMTLVLTRVLPKLIIPLFYKLRPLPEGELKQSISLLCERSGLPVSGVYEILFSEKTKKANAAVVGIGKSRRMLLSDTLLARYTRPEIEMVVAHELGHHAEKHIQRSILFDFTLAFLGFYLLSLLSARLVSFLRAESLADLAIFPVLALLSFLGSILILPLQNLFSRWQEKRADRFALRIFPSHEVFASLMRKLSSQNLADPSPPAWLEFILYSHPSAKNRIKYANEILAVS